jgi:hypothetical protein
VNIQVNNYGGMSKEEILAKLTGRPVAIEQSAPVELPAAEPVSPDVKKPTRQQVVAEAMKAEEV